MLKRVKIHNLGNLHCSIYCQAKENEESNQMPALSTKQKAQGFDLSLHNIIIKDKGRKFKSIYV